MTLSGHCAAGNRLDKGGKPNAVTTVAQLGALSISRAPPRSSNRDFDSGNSKFKEQNVDCVIYNVKWLINIVNYRNNYSIILV